MEAMLAAEEAAEAKKKEATLLKNKAAINAKDTDGLTPLHKAAWNGHLTVVTALVAAGADTAAKDNDGFTPIVKAKNQGKANVVTYLTSFEGKKK